MAKRRGLSRSLRFEVFKRDSFTCQYCGAKAPDAVLQADHVHPVSKGGTDELLNLVTACQACNSGKSDRLLSDDSALKKQKAQLDELQARREQLDMLMEWKRGLVALDSQATEQLMAMWADLAPGWSFSAEGKRGLHALVLKCGASDVADAMREAAAEYIKIDADGKATKESWIEAWGRCQRIAKIAPAYREKPYLKDLFYIRAIVRNRFTYAKPWIAKDLLEQAFLSGCDRQQLKSVACSENSWGAWQDEMIRLINSNSEGEA